MSSATNAWSDETYITGLNRYPDPHQRALKQLVCNLRNSQAEPKGALTPDNLFCGVGSDEAIDAIMRVFCKPAREKLMICTPTYGMYNVSAAINEVEVVDVPLQVGTWQIDTEKVPLLIFYTNIDCLNIEIRSSDQITPVNIPRKSNRQGHLAFFRSRSPLSNTLILERRPSLRRSLH